MTAEQRFDLVAESNYQVCVRDDGIVTDMMNPCSRHEFDGNNDIGAHHYDVIGSPVIEVSRTLGIVWHARYHWGDERPQ